MKNGARTGLAGWALSICVCFSQLVSAQSSIIKGRIYDAETFSDVSHVNVLVRDENGNVITSITSNYNGLYSTDSIEPGTYRIEAFSREFEKSIVHKLVVQPAKASVFDIPLERKKEETAREEDKKNPKSDILEMLGGIVKSAALSGL
ncbi:MAG TPA: hypothetical protein DCG19_10700 [Cryomorphaceae bacterium]|nr:hypothetical protein [Owenweeksia sp.]MBF99108.1 hypothetical protein [Owenweeksia sp.]HAD97866.1 hypothetical protein [Cryomorphaceae bacterium]|tara:strand:+ start:674 stop:1117 length:444 start_codon:yes stop_codon:yes gene_type:complete